MKRLIFLIYIAVQCTCLYAQKNGLKDKLYKIENRIINGDTEALKEIAKYLDDETFVEEFLGYHNYPNTARGIAIRVLEENCLFAPGDYIFDSALSTSKFFKTFLDKKVVFDDTTGMFLISSLSERKMTYELKELSEYDLQRIDTTITKSPYPEWYYENQIDAFLRNKDPHALIWIASAWYKKRARFNRYYFNDEEFLDLIRKLTHIDLGVPDEKSKITFLYKDDYYAKARLNYLIYWVKHFKDYKWNEEKGYFENIKESPAGKTKEEILFGLLNSENDSVAIDAFTQLAELDTENVKKLSGEYERNSMDVNSSIPTFPFRFLKQMVLLTQYCRDNGIEYKASSWLLDSLTTLKNDRSFCERYRLENNIISSLELKDVTSIEYFGLIHEEEWDLTYSIGRILDKFYSRNWEELISDKKYLELYLKKSKLFDDLGIIGICNKYLRKFENCSNQTINNVKTILNNTQDFDIRQQATKVISTYTATIHPKTKEKKLWEGNNEKYGVNDLKLKYQKIKISSKKEDDKKWDIQELFGQINYKQIGEAIKILQKDTSMNAYNKFTFIESDFGFNINYEDSLELEDFLKIYNWKGEHELYQYYLKKTGMNCFDRIGNLFFPGIYEVLKYDVVDAFVGGGGGRRDEGVYLVIKLLELNFKTTLGFPKKLCNWQGIYACHCDDRAKAWMQFLEEKGLVNPDKAEPPSISYNY